MGCEDEPRIGQGGGDGNIARVRMRIAAGFRAVSRASFSDEAATKENRFESDEALIFGLIVGGPLIASLVYLVL